MSRVCRVTVVSPHFDDAPLSLGQSMLDGSLSRCRVRVEVLFGRTNYTRWVHPTRARARAISLWRRGEEALAQARFGYRVHSHDLEEAVLRTGELDPDVIRDAGTDPVGDPTFGDVVARLRRLRGAGGLFLVPVGLGDHLDHRIVAEAGRRLAREHDDGIGFYEDRPYASVLQPEEIADQVARLGLDLEPVTVSGPISASMHRWLRRCYPSQIDDRFAEWLDRDSAEGAVERVWLPAGQVPGWLRFD